MKKTARPVPKSATHFEQIPVEVVKKVAPTVKAPAPAKATRRVERPA